MSDLFLTFVLLLACFGSCCIGVGLLKDIFARLIKKKSKRKEKSLNEIQRKVENILNEYEN